MSTPNELNGGRTLTNALEAGPLPAQSGLTTLPMTTLLERLRRGELSPVELIDAHIRRIQAVNPSINAVVADRFEAARREAEQAEREYSASSEARPLLGIPFTIKEMIEVRGMPHTFGTRTRRDRIGARDATVVWRLRAAGAIPLGVTNLPEWGMWCESYNRLYGRTKNPWSLRRSPGGSSGGEGAVVGAGGSVFGIGSDVGGSVRIPAAFCGVFGHKPTAGLLPLTGHYPVLLNTNDAPSIRTSPYMSIGTFTRSASDIAPLMRAMAGRDGIDPNAEPIAFLNPDRVEWKGRRIMLLPDPTIDRASHTNADVAAAVERAGKLFESRGAIVSHAPRQLFEHVGDVWFGALQNIGAPSFRETIGGGRRVHTSVETLRALLGIGRFSWSALLYSIGERITTKNEHAMRDALREMRRLVRRYREQIGPDGIMISPVHPRTAPLHNLAILRPFDFLYTAAFNTLRVPATAVPFGFDRNHMPMAVQITSARGNDHVTIAAAAVVEEATPPWQPAPVRNATAS